MSRETSAEQTRPSDNAAAVQRDNQCIMYTAVSD
jgi:hypothetical protein